MKPQKIAIIVTSHAKLGGTARPTGFWLEELAVPYYELRAAGAIVDIASPAGGSPPVDPASRENPSPGVRRFLADREACDQLEHSLRVRDLTDSYDGYFVAGGHGVMWDLAEDASCAALLSKAIQTGKIVAAVCHGPAALVQAKLADGRSIVAGKRVAAFSNEEEQAVGLTNVVPFALESRLRELGARYERGPNWSSFVIRDGNLITGQNPQSSERTAQEMLLALRAREPSQL
jgi:putative intracellular protease/amidase